MHHKINCIGCTAYRRCDNKNITQITAAIKAYRLQNKWRYAVAYRTVAA